MDVISGVPPEAPGVDIDTIRCLREASIVIEVWDSMSNDVLARAFERQRPIGPFDRKMIAEETRRQARAWSWLLRTRLEELSEL